MRYRDAVAAAPPGSGRFAAADLARLGRTTLNLLLQPGPSAPPLEDVAAALGDQPGPLRGVASSLPPERGERLLRLAQRPVTANARADAARRVVRGAFWYLVYELAPELWDRLAEKEPVAPELLADLPADGARVVEVGAGTGRLTGPLVGRAAALVAIEPCAPLRRLLRRRHPGVHVVAGVGHRLPLAGGWADLVVSCATFGPHPPLGGEGVLTELERCAGPAGAIALVGPEDPGWWQAHGFERTVYRAPRVSLEPDLAAFFGQAQPPHELLFKHLP